MELDFNKIERIIEIRQIKSKLSEEENSFTTPMMRNMDMVSELYNKFLTIAPTMTEDHINSVNCRKKFLFIVLYMFCPSVLAGGKMPKGLRDELSKVLGIHSKSTISDNCSDVSFLYKNYSKFKKEVNEIFRKLME